MASTVNARSEMLLGSISSSTLRETPGSSNLEWRLVVQVDAVSVVLNHLIVYISQEFQFLIVQFSGPQGIIFAFRHFFISSVPGFHYSGYSKRSFKSPSFFYSNQPSLKFYERYLTPKSGRTAMMPPSSMLEERILAELMFKPLNWLRITPINSPASQTIPNVSVPSANMTSSIYWYCT